MNLFIAGCENGINRVASLSANNPNMLLSYYHLTKGKHKMDEKYVQHYHKLKGLPNVKFITDSGLFTMMFGAGSGKTYTYEDLHHYTDRYLANINAMGYEDYIVEMDVIKLLGRDKLQSFRDKFIAHYPIEKTIFVWHVEETIEGWDEMCRRYPYVALSIPELRIVMKRKYLKNFTQKMIKRALEINPDIKIHLLGCTSNYLLEQGGYYSADSTSWQGSLRFGDFAVPHNRQKLSRTQMEKLSNSKAEDIQFNTNLLKEKYGVSAADKNTTNQNISVTSIAFYRHMAENVTRDFFDAEYPVFDEEMKPIIKRVTNK